MLLNGSTIGGGSLEDLKGRRSQNMTECVPVPSSEHVAEIVGRQGESIFHYFKFFLIRLQMFFFVSNGSLFTKLLESKILSFLSHPLLAKTWFLKVVGVCSNFQWRGKVTAEGLIVYMVFSPTTHTHSESYPQISVIGNEE